MERLLRQRPEGVRLFSLREPEDQTETDRLQGEFGLSKGTDIQEGRYGQPV